MAASVCSIRAFAAGSLCLALAAGAGAAIAPSFAYADDAAAFEQEAASDSRTVGAGSVIEQGGTYQLAPGASDGTLEIRTSEPVTIVGSGLQSGKSNYFTIECTVPGAHVTLQNVKIDNATEQSCSALRFTGSGNVLTVEGQNALQLCYNNQGDKAIVYVPADGDLTIDGTGELYMYKHSYAASAIGADDGGACGDITIAGATLRILGINGGSAIGGEGSGSVSITGGDVAVYAWNKMAAIGSDNAVVSGGTVALGAGNGAVTFGGKNLTVLGGHIVADADSVLSTPRNGAGEALVAYNLDISNAVAADGIYSVSVDGAPYYAGSLDYATYLAGDASSADSWESVPENWIAHTASEFALYLTEEDHVIDVNGVKTWLSYDGKGGFAASDKEPGDGSGDDGQDEGGDTPETPETPGTPGEGDEGGEGDDGPDTPGENPDGDAGDGDDTDNGDDGAPGDGDTSNDGEGNGGDGSKTEGDDGVESDGSPNEMRTDSKAENFSKSMAVTADSAAPLATGAGLAAAATFAAAAAAGVKRFRPLK